MISIEDARFEMDKVLFSPDVELVPIFDSYGRILAQDVCSKINMPPFNKSAMDGYAISSMDKSKKFRIIETIAAGKLPTKEINIGECSKIMTGAPIPDGADKVLKIELTNESDGFMIPVGDNELKNICYLGEDIKKGDTVLSRGLKLNASSIGLIASMGLDKIQVYKRPVIGLITTGAEIVEPGVPLMDGQIYNSNAYSLYMQLIETGAVVNYIGIVGDNIENTKKVIADTIEISDMVVISGGVSMGEFDFVPHVLKELGVKIHFDRVAIKPGKPTTFGSIKNKIVFGLPGNPVSTFVITEVFVKETLYRMMGYKYNPFMINGILEKNYKRKKSDRDSFIPVIYKNGIISFPEYHGSAHLGALTEANGLLLVKKGINEIIKGTNINVRQI